MFRGARHGALRLTLECLPGNVAAPHTIKARPEECPDPCVIHKDGLKGAHVESAGCPFRTAANRCVLVPFLAAGAGPDARAALSSGRSARASGRGGARTAGARRTAAPPSSGGSVRARRAAFVKAGCRRSRSTPRSRARAWLHPDQSWRGPITRRTSFAPRRRRRCQGGQRFERRFGRRRQRFLCGTKGHV